MSALTKKVLIVDDDPVVAKSFDRVLGERGYVVITARDGEEALTKMKNEEYDVVFTDIKMPGMSGLEVAERVKARRPWTPVVIVTGYGSPANKARAEAAGVSGFLDKPLSPEMIEQSALKAVLEGEAAAAKRARAEPALTQPAPALPEAAPKPAWKTVGMMLAAPFLGLAFVVAFPLYGLVALARMGIRELVRREAPRKIAGHTKDVVLFIAAPIIGLAYFLAFPVVGIAMLAWMGTKTWIKNGKTK